MITSDSNPRVKWVRALQQQRKARQAAGAFVIEGSRLAQEALDCGSQPRLVFHLEALPPGEADLLQQFAQRGAELLMVSGSVLRKCSALETPPGLLAVLSMPQLPLPERVDLGLIVDRLSDPGNLGALLRTALAAGVQVVYLTEGTVDAYNPKVVRGAMGAHLRLPLQRLEPGADLERLGLRLRIADPQAGQPYDRLDWRVPTALVIGSEAHGPGQALRRAEHDIVHIPMRNRVESLNAAVAAGIILFEITRQRGGA